MPYIKPEDRIVMDGVVQHMIDKGVEPNGKLNYVLFKLCLNTVGKEPSYGKFKNFCGELSECIAEIRRRMTAEYENKKIEENGDVESTDDFNMTAFKYQQLKK